MFHLSLLESCTQAPILSSAENSIASLHSELLDIVLKSLLLFLQNSLKSTIRRSGEQSLGSLEAEGLERRRFLLFLHSLNVLAHSGGLHLVHGLLVEESSLGLFLVIFLILVVYQVQQGGECLHLQGIHVKLFFFLFFLLGGRQVLQRIFQAPIRRSFDQGCPGLQPNSFQVNLSFFHLKLDSLIHNFLGEVAGHVHIMKGLHFHVLLRFFIVSREAQHFIVVLLLLVSLIVQGHFRKCF
mmetsp:Transcript_100780/g.178905  ORF Transcript_100780/g.178905 Transcript_100780/m.178905 type:complete len:240 (+) Transcript_100780:256-975(+)